MSKNILKYGDYDTIMSIINVLPPNEYSIYSFNANTTIFYNQKIEILNILIKKRGADLSISEYNNILKYGNYDTIMSIINVLPPDEDSIYSIINNEVVFYNQKKTLSGILQAYKDNDKNIDSIKELVEKKYNRIYEIFDENHKVKTDKNECKIINKNIKQFYKKESENIQTTANFPDVINNIVNDYNIPLINCDTSSYEEEKKEETHKNKYFNKYKKYKNKYLQLKYN